MKPPADGRIDEASLVGMHIGDRFRLLELIGEGGMGGVFRAEQLATQRVVALKLLHPELAHIEYIKRRFEREAKAASRLSHPNIVEVLDYGESNGHLYIAMELVVGRSLADLLARGDLGAAGSGLLQRARRLGRPRPAGERIAQTIAIMRQVLGALEHSHGRGVVHRDLKPDNIMLLPPADDSAVAHVKLLDFGIAKLADEAPANTQALTQAGIPLGTPQYMSPEQATGEATDTRSDLYSCGVILYEMLTGRLPFDAPSTVQLLSMHVTVTPEPLRAVAPQAQIPEALERLVLRALAKHRQDRFASAGELRQALDEIGGRGAGSGASAVAHAGHVHAGHVAASDARYGVPRWMRAVAGTVAIGLAGLVVADHHWASPAPADGGSRSSPAAASSPKRSSSVANAQSAPRATGGSSPAKPAANPAAAKRRKSRAR